jgi:DNA-binding IclR family transcriptional regulator
VIRSDEAIFITSNEALACDHPGLLRVRDEDHACATMPLHGAEGAVIGSANLSWEAPREFSDADRVEVAALLAECEQELARRLAA